MEKIDDPLWCYQINPIGFINSRDDSYLLQLSHPLLTWFVNISIAGYRLTLIWKRENSLYARALYPSVSMKWNAYSGGTTTTNIICKLSNTKDTDFVLSAWREEIAVSSGIVWTSTAVTILLPLLPSQPSWPPPSYALIFSREWECV